MKQIILLITLAITNVINCSSEQASQIGNMLTINGVLHRQLPNSEYWFSADNKIPGAWIIWQTIPDKKTKRPLPQQAVIIFGLGHKIAKNGAVLYHEQPLQQVAHHAHECFVSGTKLKNRESALQELRKIHQNSNPKQQLSKLTHNDGLNILTGYKSTK